MGGGGGGGLGPSCSAWRRPHTRTPPRTHCHRSQASELQQLLEGLTRLALQPPLEWMQRFVGALAPRLGELAPRELAGVLGSLAAQQYKPRPEMAAGVLAATQANMKEVSRSKRGRWG